MCSCHGEQRTAVGKIIQYRWDEDGIRQLENLRRRLLIFRKGFTTKILFLETLSYKYFLSLFFLILGWLQMVLSTPIYTSKWRLQVSSTHFIFYTLPFLHTSSSFSIFLYISLLLGLLGYNLISYYSWANEGKPNKSPPSRFSPKPLSSPCLCSNLQTSWSVIPWS